VAEADRVSVDVVIRLPHGAAALSERFEITAGSLEEALELLKAFHELAEKIRDGQAGLISRGELRGTPEKKGGDI
jgi:hypothetical protein